MLVPFCPLPPKIEAAFVAMWPTRWPAPSRTRRLYDIDRLIRDDWYPPRFCSNYAPWRDGSAEIEFDPSLFNLPAGDRLIVGVSALEGFESAMRAMGIPADVFRGFDAATQVRPSDES